MDENGFLSSLIHREVGFRYSGSNLTFDLTTALFSSASVDAGTVALLRLLEPVIANAPPERVLDVGCGTGTLGIAVAASTGAALCATDRDALAVWFTRHNARRNGLSDCVAFPALVTHAPLDDHAVVPPDLALCNLPAKVGQPVLEQMIRALPRLVTPGGNVGVVIVKPLAGLLEETLQGFGARIVSRRATAGHLAVIYSEPDERTCATLEDAAATGPAEASGPAAAANEGAASDPTAASNEGAASDPAARAKRSDDFLPSVYIRGNHRFDGPGGKYELTAVHNLPEFDSLSHGTELVFKIFRRAPPGGRVFVWGGGQGHIPVGGLRETYKGEITVADRDLLAVAASTVNLCRSHPRATVSPLVAPGISSAVASVDQKVDWMIVQSHPEPGSLWADEIAHAAVQMLAPGGRLLVVSRSTSLARLIPVIQRSFTGKESVRHHGYRADLLIRKH